MFHFDKSGNSVTEVLFEKSQLKSFALLISQSDISGKDINPLQLLNMPDKSSAFDTFHYDISGTVFSEVHS